MKELLAIFRLLGLLALTVSCGKDQSLVGSQPSSQESNHNVPSVRREIIAGNVLAAQLAPHHEFETRTTFAPTEAIPASLSLTMSPYVEPRRISAFLILDEGVVEEQSIAVGANEKREDFDFSFDKKPRPAGTYQIRFIEIARSNGKPVLLARLFLNVE